MKIFLIVVRHFENSAYVQSSKFNAAARLRLDHQQVMAKVSIDGFMSSEIFGYSLNHEFSIFMSSVALKPE